MVEQDAVPLVMLELLSNTAMLKKVLDRKSERKGARSQDKPSAAVQVPREKAPSTVSVPSPTSLIGESNQRGESPSPHTITDSTREAPPMVQERTGYAPIPIPPTYYHYNRVEVESSRVRSNHVEGTNYPGNGFHRGFIHGARGDRYFIDHCNGAAAATPQMASHRLPAGARVPYAMKENLPPRHYLGGAMYNERPAVDGRRSGMTETMYRPPSRVATFEDHDDSRNPSYETLARESHHLREQLKEKDMVVSSLQQRVNYLEKQIGELRQLPTGKISHIPIDDMIRIMQDYGSEVSNQTLPKRKDDIKKASIVRQFRRWNPEFFRYFIHVNGEWVPKLGEEGELKRRVEKRRVMKRNQVMV